MGYRLVPIGGVGEFGANSMLVEHDEQRILLDVGAAFTDLEAFGVGYEVPDFAALGSPEPAAVVLTHAHDDHVKGLTVLREAFPSVSVWGSRTTLARARGAANGIGPLSELRQGIAHGVGGFAVEVLPVSHSVPGTVVVRLVADGLRMVLATDLRLAPSALGETTSAAALQRWGDEGVDVLLLDSTNAPVDHQPPSEEQVAAALAEQVAAATGAVIGVTFASHVGRFRQLALAAHAAGRVVVPVGRGLVDSLDVHESVSGLGLPFGVVRRARELRELPRDRVVVVATGSQAEPGSAFARLGVDLLPGLTLAPGDLVLHAARTIPGNERHVAALFDHCSRRGARVVTAEQAPIHSSGHAHVAELETMLELLRPAWVLPVHGRRRHLQETAILAGRHGCRVALVENGEELIWEGGELKATGESRGVGRLLFGDTGEQVLDSAVLRHRRVMAQEGMVVAVLAKRRGADGIFSPPELHAFGMELDAASRARLATELLAELKRGNPLALSDPDWLRSTMSQWLRTELRRRTRRRPAVVALVMEI